MIARFKAAKFRLFVDESFTLAHRFVVVGAHPVRPCFWPCQACLGDLMELLFILPWLLGFAAYELFTSDNDDDSTDSDTNNAPTDVPTPTQPTNKVVEGTGNADTIRSGEGDDFVLGAVNADKLEGGKGDDILLGENGADDLYGGIGYDTLLGGAGDDKLFGGKGYDFMVGGTGNDYLIGNEGEDTLVGSSGKDTLEGGAADDLISGIDALGVDPLAVNFVDGSAGAAADLAALKSYVSTTYGTAAPTALVDRLEDALTEPAASDEDDLLFGGKGNDTILADNSDTISGGAGNDDLQLISDGAGEAIVVSDFEPTQDKINIFVPTGTNPAISLVNGATAADGVSVVVAGDVVAILRGLVVAEIPNGRITVTVL